MDLTTTTGEISTATLALWTMAVDFAPRFLAALVILVVGIVLARAAGRGVLRLLGISTHIDPTFRGVVAAAVRYAIMLLVIIAVLGQLGIETTSLLAALAGAGLAIGLALQGTLSNIAAGLMLLWLRPFRVGETIESGVVNGTVEEVGLFATELKTAEGVYRFVPNSQLWSTQIVNYSRNPSRMVDARVTIPYSADIAEARRILLDLARSHDKVLKTPAPEVFVDSYGDTSTVLVFRPWVPTKDFSPLRRSLVEEAKRRLDEAGITAAFRRP
jgi:small conductance mechanosensitive channel